MLQNGVLANPDINQAVQNNLNRSAFVAIPPTVYNPRFPQSPATLYATPDVPPGAPGVRLEDSVLSRIINAMNSLPPGSRAEISPSVFEEIEPLLFGRMPDRNAVRGLQNHGEDPPPAPDSQGNQGPAPSDNDAEDDVLNPDLIPEENVGNSSSGMNALAASSNHGSSSVQDIHSGNSSAAFNSSSTRTSSNLDVRAPAAPFLSGANPTVLLSHPNLLGSNISSSLGAAMPSTASISSMNSPVMPRSSSINSSSSLDRTQAASTFSDHDVGTANANILNAFSNPGTSTPLGYRGMHTPTPAATPFNHMNLINSPLSLDILQRSVSRGVNLMSPIHPASTGNAAISNLNSDLNTFAAPSNMGANSLGTTSSIQLNPNSFSSNVDFLQRAASVGLNVGTNPAFSNSMFPSNSGNIPANFLSNGVDFAKPSMFSNPNFSNASANQRPATSFNCPGKSNKRSAKEPSTVKRKYSKKADTTAKNSRNAWNRHKYSDAKLPPITPSNNGLSGLNLPSACGLQLPTTSNANGNFISPQNRAFDATNTSSNFALDALRLMTSSGAISNRSTPFSNVLDFNPSFTLGLNATNLPSSNFLNASAILNANAIAQLSSTFGSPAPSQNSPLNQDFANTNTLLNYARNSVNLPTASDPNFANSLSLSDVNAPSTSLRGNMDLANSIDYSKINNVDMDDVSTPNFGLSVLETPEASDANITASSSNSSANILTRSSSVETEVCGASSPNIVANSVITAGGQIDLPSQSNQMVPNTTGAIEPSSSDPIAIDPAVATSSQSTDQNKVDPTSRQVPGTSTNDVIVIEASSNEPGTSCRTSSSVRDSLQNDLPSGPDPMQLLIDAISEEIDAEEEVLNSTKQVASIAQPPTQQSTQQPVENEIPDGPVDTANLLDGYDFGLVPPNIQDVVHKTQRQLLLLEDLFNMRPNAQETINAVDRSNWDYETRSFRPVVIPQAIERPLRRQYKPRNKNLEPPAPIKSASKVAATIIPPFNEQFFQFLWPDGKRIGPSTSGSRQMVSQPSYMQQFQNANVTSNRTNSSYRNNGQRSDDMETEPTQGTSNSDDHIFKKPSSAGVRRKTKKQDFEERKQKTTGTSRNEKLENNYGSYQAELETSPTNQLASSSSYTELDHQTMHASNMKSMPKNVRNSQSYNLLKKSLAEPNAGNYEHFGETRKASSVKKSRVTSMEAEPCTFPVPAISKIASGTTAGPSVQRNVAKEESRITNGNQIGRSLGPSRIKEAYLIRTIPTREEKEDGGNHICLWGTCRMEFADHSLFVEHVSHHVVSDGAHDKKCLWNGCLRTTPFDALYKIQTHVRGHTKETPFHCNEPGCEKSYLRMENLRTHQRVHTGERPYVCRVCEKNFTNSSDREKHQKRVHSSEKHHPCMFPGCERNYTDPSSLRKHFLKNHPEMANDFHSGSYRMKTKSQRSAPYDYLDD